MKNSDFKPLWPPDPNLLAGLVWDAKFFCLFVCCLFCFFLLHPLKTANRELSLRVKTKPQNS